MLAAAFIMAGVLTSVAISTAVERSSGTPKKQALIRGLFYTASVVAFILVVGLAGSTEV